jgi:Amt family ammonium transporter
VVLRRLAHLVYVPIAHWVWGGGFLARAGLLDFAAGRSSILNAGSRGLVAAFVVGKRLRLRHGQFLALRPVAAVIGTGLLWVGWLGFNGGSALGRQFPRRLRDHRDPPRSVQRRVTWMFLEWWTRAGRRCSA